MYNDSLFSFDSLLNFIEKLEYYGYFLAFHKTNISFKIRFNFNLKFNYLNVRAGLIYYE